jgi:1,4-dihydroxy-2-naphthoate octaprenyltransferase
VTHAAPPRPSWPAVWWAAARPKTLAAAVVPVAIGSALAWTDGRFHLLAALCALVAASLIQIGTNLANDLFDFLKGADTDARVGPVRVTAAGWVSPQTMRVATGVAFGLAFASGLYLVWRGGWPILAVGLVSIALGVLYTATRYALAYTGLADVVVFVFFGPVAVAGTYYVQALGVTPASVAAGIAPGLLATALLVVNNLRDWREDAAANKRTLIVRFGPRFGHALLLACVLGAALTPPLVVALAGGAGWGALAASLVAVSGLRAWRRARAQEGRALLPVLGETARLLALYGALFVPGWLLTA